MANGRKQARAPKTMPFGAEAFESRENTVIRWLGLAGFLINSRGTVIMVDPVLKGFDMPLLIDAPIDPATVPKLDAVLVTHSDNDHYSVPTCRALANATGAFHSTAYVASIMRHSGFLSYGHSIGEAFRTGKITVKLTPADHAWQNSEPKATRVFSHEDACGFRMETPDGSIWAPGDSRLMQEHLNMPAPDAIFFDFSDNEWHFGLKGAAQLANTYPGAELLLCHWGYVDAPDFSPFNGDPDVISKMIVNPERARVLAPGEAFVLK